MLSGVASPELKAVAGEFRISMTSVSKMHEEIERMGEIDLRLQKMFRRYKVRGLLPKRFFGYLWRKHQHFIFLSY